MAQFVNRMLGLALAATRQALGDRCLPSATRWNHLGQLSKHLVAMPRKRRRKPLIQRWRQRNAVLGAIPQRAGGLTDRLALGKRRGESQLINVGNPVPKPHPIHQPVPPCPMQITSHSISHAHELQIEPSILISKVMHLVEG